MKFLKNLFDKKEFKIREYRLKFDEKDHNWHVTKGHSILYVGEESACRKYLNTI